MNGRVGYSKSLGRSNQPKRWRRQLIIVMFVTLISYSLFIIISSVRLINISNSTEEIGYDSLLRHSLHHARDGDKRGGYNTKQLDSKKFVGHLDCSAHGGPSSDSAAEMVYWSEVPSDKAFASPFYSKDSTSTRKYLTFDPDFGGFNNVRMNFETVILLAHSMGRTLVLPPSRSVYWSKSGYSFERVYNIEKIRSEQDGLDIITAEQYLNLTQQSTDMKFDAYTPSWKPNECMAAFPKDSGLDSLELLRKQYNISRHEVHNLRNFDTDIPVDASPEERLRVANIEGRGAKMCIYLYDDLIRDKPVIHFPCCENQATRLLVHHYNFLFFQNWRQESWSKRFVRDNLRYRDEIQCAAARIVAALRQKATQYELHDIKGEFDSFHIRRNDMIRQFKSRTGVSAEHIYNVSEPELRANGTVFIATDEKNRTFFAPLIAKYNVFFLSDFEHELEGIDTMHFGMIDQLVASRGRVFFGCYVSTFSNFIFRMRGYRSQMDKSKHYKNGTILDSYYYNQPHHKYDYQEDPPFPSQSWAREWPQGLRDIDIGIGDMV